LCRRRKRYKYVSVVERPQQCSHQQLELVEGISPRGLTYLCTEKAGYINSAPLYICRVVLFLLRLRHGAGLVFGSVAALAFASCTEHVAEAIFFRPHPPTPFVLCTVPTQSSKLERSEKQLNFLVRETCAHYLHFLVPGPNRHTEFLTFFLLRALFLPRSPHLQAAFSRELFNLEPSVIDAVRTSSLSCLIRPGTNLVGKTWLKTTTKELGTNSSALPPTPPHPEV